MCLGWPVRALRACQVMYCGEPVRQCVLLIAAPPALRWPPRRAGRAHRRLLVRAVLASLWLPLQGLARLLLRQIRSDVAAIRAECLEADVLGNVSDQVAVDEDVFDGVHNSAPGIIW